MAVKRRKSPAATDGRRGPREPVASHADEPLDEHIMVRMPRSMKQRLEAVAQKDRRPAAAWARLALEREIERASAA